MSTLNPSAAMADLHVSPTDDLGQELRDVAARLESNILTRLSQRQKASNEHSSLHSKVTHEKDVNP